MSRLSNNIEATLTGQVKHVSDPVINLTDSVLETRNVQMERILEYKIGCEIGVFGFAYDAIELQRVKENARLSIIESVFGEFRSPLYALKRALYNRDYRAAEELANKLLYSMFEE